MDLMMMSTPWSFKWQVALGLLVSVLLHNAFFNSERRCDDLVATPLADVMPCAA